MNTAYLIDGYNLLHAMGILVGRVAPAGLEKARQRLLDYLGSAHSSEEGAAVTVVFDAGHAPPGVPAECHYRGLHIRFAVKHQEADDLIEELIQEARVPKHLHVVSDDHRIQRAARRRHCHVLGCTAYLDQVERQRQRRREDPPEAAGKDGCVSDSEARQWLAEFADLADDANFKELFRMYDFPEE